MENIFPKTGATVIYRYDFGDGWKHQIEIIEFSNTPQNELLRSFVSGQNAYPTEDCGGIYRYREIIKILVDSTHEEYESILKWLGPNFNPIEFNRLTIEKGLGILGAKIKGYEKGFE